MTAKAPTPMPNVKRPPAPVAPPPSKQYAKLALPKKEPWSNTARSRVAVGDSTTQVYVERHTDNLYASFESLVQAVKFNIKTPSEVSDIRGEIDAILEEAKDKIIGVLVREGIIERPSTPFRD